MRRAPESHEVVQNRRNLVAGGSVGFAVLALGYTLGTGPLEQSPAFPIDSSDAAALAALHTRVPDASRTDNLKALVEDRNKLFRELLCRDGSKASDQSVWYHKDIPTGDSAKPFNRQLTHDTRFECKDRTWKMEGTADDLALTTERGLWGADWAYTVQMSSKPTALIQPESK